MNTDVNKNYQDISHSTKIVQGIIICLIDTIKKIRELDRRLM